MTAEDRFLTDKRIFLNNPGTQKSDLYYSKANAEVDQTEVVFYTGRFHTGLTNRSFGGGGSVNIPNANFVGTAYLQVQLPAIIADQTIGRGWLFSLIDSIDYIYGGSNLSNIQINGQTLFQTVMAECETSEKRSQMLRLAGEEQLVPTTNAIVGQIILPLPFSSACSLNAKKPYDTSLLASPIQININFKPARAIYGGNAVTPSQFDRAQIILRQGQMSNPGQGLGPILKQIPDALYNYPIIHKQSVISRFTSGPAVSGKTGFFQGAFDILSIINADLIGILIGIVPTLSVSPTGNDTPNPFVYEDVEDVEILWNGSILYRGQDNLHELFQCKGNIGATFWENSQVNAGVLAPFTSSPVNNNMIIVDMSRLREICYDGTFSNSIRLPQQPVSVTCSVRQNNTAYTVYTTLLYNGMISTEADKTSLIYFN